MVCERKAPPTVFHITHYKAGSQWVYAVLRAIAPKRVVTPRVGAAHVTSDNPIPGLIYPTVYLARKAFASVEVSGPTRVFVIIRDLRDTLISLYFSHRFSHPEIDQAVVSSRRELNRMDVQEGLTWLLENRLQVSARIQRSWAGAGALLITYEQLLVDELSCFKRIVDYCEIDVGVQALARSVEAASFERVTTRKKGEEDIYAHHRKAVAGDWRNYFDDGLKARFKELYGSTLIATGYERDGNW